MLWNLAAALGCSGHCWIWNCWQFLGGSFGLEPAQTVLSKRQQVRTRSAGFSGQLSARPLNPSAYIGHSRIEGTPKKGHVSMRARCHGMKADSYRAADT